jgi:hypothetical protein
MFIDKSVSAVRPPMEADGETLAEGLTLLRASALKLIRLQLAISRNERIAALEAVDGLLALDRQLRDYLSAFPAIDHQSTLVRGIDADRSALNDEKLSLSAEVLCRRHRVTEPLNTAYDSRPVEYDEDLLPSTATLPAPKHRGSRWLAFALVLLAGATAAACIVAGVDPAAWMAPTSGLVR